MEVPTPPQNRGQAGTVIALVLRAAADEGIDAAEDGSNQPARCRAQLLAGRQLAAANRRAQTSQHAVGGDARLVEHQERFETGGTLQSRQGLHIEESSEKRRVGKGWVSTCRFRWSPFH